MAQANYVAQRNIFSLNPDRLHVEAWVHASLMFIALGVISFPQTVLALRGSYLRSY